MAKQEQHVYEIVQEAVQARAQKLEELHRMLTEQEQAKEQAEAEMQRTISAGDVDGYTTAKSAVRTAADSIEFFGIQIRNLEGSPTVENPAERAGMVKAIRDHVAEYKDTRYKKVAGLLREALALADEVCKEIKQANRLLDELATNTGSTPERVDIAAPNAVHYRIRQAAQHAVFEKYND